MTLESGYSGEQCFIVRYRDIGLRIDFIKGDVDKSSSGWPTPNNISTLLWFVCVL